MNSIAKWLLKRTYMILWILGATTGVVAGITCLHYGITLGSKLYFSVGLGLITLVAVSLGDKIIILVYQKSKGEKCSKISYK